MRSILPFTREEAYEVAEAIENDDLPELRNELGDLLFQVAIYSRMAEDRDAFRFEDVIEAICEKVNDPACRAELGKQAGLTRASGNPSAT